MNKPNKLFIWPCVCFASWLVTGCQQTTALTASRPDPALIQRWTCPHKHQQPILTFKKVDGPIPRTNQRFCS